MELESRSVKISHRNGLAIRMTYVFLMVFGGCFYSTQRPYKDQLGLEHDLGQELRQGKYKSKTRGYKGGFSYRDLSIELM